MKRILSLAVLMFACALAGCATSKPDHGSTSGAAIQLTATLTSPTDIQLKWSDGNPHVAWHTVEYANDPNGPFIILGFFPPEQTAFMHSNLMPQTTFYYRVRAICGPVSAPLVVSLPDALSETEYIEKYAGKEDFSWAAPETTAPKMKVTTASIRAGKRAAAPTGLRSTLVVTTVSGFKLAWTDHANDEDGYLLEMKPENSRNYQVSALLKPDINMLGYALSPPERKATFRVRAFYFGASSAITQQVTELRRPDFHER